MSANELPNCAEPEVRTLWALVWVLATFADASLAAASLAATSLASPPSSQRTRWALAVGQSDESQAGWLAARLVRMLCRPTSTWGWQREFLFVQLCHDGIVMWFPGWGVWRMNKSQSGQRMPFLPILLQLAPTRALYAMSREVSCSQFLIFHSVFNLCI